MKITEWYARAVAAGIMLDWNNIYAKYTKNQWFLYSTPTGWHTVEMFHFILDSRGKEGDIIQLRKNGVDRVELWTKEDIPTEEHIGKMCWFYRNETVILDVLFEIIRESGLIIYDRLNESAANYAYDYCLLATNGNIAPKPKDFRKAYGEI